MNTELALQMLAELRAVRALLEKSIHPVYTVGLDPTLADGAVLSSPGDVVYVPPAHTKKVGWPKGKPRARKAK